MHTRRIHNVLCCELKIPPLGITVRHHSTSLVMSNSYPRDEMFNLHLTIITDSYNPFIELCLKQKRSEKYVFVWILSHGTNRFERTFYSNRIGKFYLEITTNITSTSLGIRCTSRHRHGQEILSRKDIDLKIARQLFIGNQCISQM